MTDDRPKCEICKDRGWLLAYGPDSDRPRVRYCSACELYKSDEEARLRLRQSLELAARLAVSGGRNCRGTKRHIEGVLSELLPTTV